MLTPLGYNRSTGLCIAVPITSSISSSPLWIPMPEGHLPRPSQILCDYAKSFDFRERSAALIKPLRAEIADQIVSKLLDVLDPIAG